MFIPKFQLRRLFSGFTLIELMMVVGIVALLIAIAYPSYTEQVRKSRRGDAEAALLEGAQLLERCFTRFNAYNNAGCPDPSGDSDNGFYAVTMARNATTWTLTAAPQGKQSTDACGTYTLDYLGNKTPAADSKRCWGSD